MFCLSALSATKNNGIVPITYHVQLKNKNKEGPTCFVYSAGILSHFFNWLIYHLVCLVNCLLFYLVRLYLNNKQFNAIESPHDGAYQAQNHWSKLLTERAHWGPSQQFLHSYRQYDQTYVSYNVKKEVEGG